MAILNTNPPMFSGQETNREMILAQNEYLEELQRRLDWVLGSLNGRNINGAALTIRVKTADGAAEVGRIGANGGGVGLNAGGTAVTVEDGAVTITSGSAGVRVTDGGGVEMTRDGKTWERLDGNAAGLNCGNVGSSIRPVYFAAGRPAATAYTIEKSVPANAKFTDTTYGMASASGAGLMSAADYTRLQSLIAGQSGTGYLPLTGGTLTGSVIVKANGRAIAHDLTESSGTVYRMFLQSASGKNKDGTYENFGQLVFNAGGSIANQMKLHKDKTTLMRPLTVGSGGTGAATAAEARANLGAAPAGLVNGSVSIGTKAEFDGKVMELYAGMANRSFGRWTVIINHGEEWYVELRKLDATAGAAIRYKHGPEGVQRHSASVYSGALTSWRDETMRPMTEAELAAILV